jgi:hypothetical protein
MGKRTHLKNTVIKCASCARANVFDQPYLYHAGFSDQGFLYKDAGNLTLTGSCYDPAYTALVGGKSPWALTLAEKQKVEEALLPAPKGGRWRFSNPARCLHCGAAISDSIERCIYLPAIRWQHSDTGFAAARSQLWSTASNRDERHERLGGVFSTSS